MNSLDKTWQIEQSIPLNEKEKYIFLQEEFNRFWTKILNNENFALMRHGDGKLAIMRGKTVNAQEGWKSPDYVTKLGKAIYDSLNIEDERVHYAISCLCCDPTAYYWYRDNITSNNITFANLWVNSNTINM